MARRTVKGTGLQVDGLTESIAVLRRLDKAYAKEATGILREGAKVVAKEARRRLGDAGRYPSGSPAGSIGYSATTRGAGNTLKASRRPWLLGAEFGEVIASVFERRVGRKTVGRIPQASFEGGRTMPPYRPPTSTDLGKNRGGYLLQPVIRKRLPMIEKQIARDFDSLTRRAFRKGGVRGR